jgi:hypothetical protein
MHAGRAIKTAGRGFPGPAENSNAAHRSNVGLGLAQALDAVAGFPLAAFPEQVDALKALQDVAFDDDTVGTLETFVLRHGDKKWSEWAKEVKT